MSKEQLTALTVKELKALAKENGLKGYSKLRKAELVEMLAVEIVATTGETSEVEEVQEVLNSYLKGDLIPATDFTFIENEALSSYEVMHDIEEMKNVSIIFPATEDYKKAKEKYYNFRSSKTWHELTEMQECELENLYDYNKPSEICYNGTFYIVHDGMVIGEDEPKKLDSKIKYTAIEDWVGNTLITYEGEQTMLADETIDTFILEFLKREGILRDDKEFYDWIESNEEEYNSCREDYYILCYDEEGNNVVWSW